MSILALRRLLPASTGPALVAGVLLAVGGCATAPGAVDPGAPAPSDPLRLQVLHTNDFHGRFLTEEVGGDSIGGSAVLAAWFDSARVRFDGPTVLLSGGDILQGTAVSNLSWGRAAIDLNNRKGLDAAALGNHEFDWGLDTLRARVEESAFPWLGANVFDEVTGDHPTWVRPWTVVERGGVRVGVVGIALAETPRIVMAGRTDGLRFEDEAPAIDRSVRELRERGVDFVVVAAHVGAVCDEPGDPDGSDPTARSRGCGGHLVDVLEAVTERVDLVVGGHTHLRNNFDVNGIPVLQAPAYSRGVTMTHLERHGDGQVTATFRAILPPRAAEVDPDTAVARVVEGWTREIRPVLERTVAVLADSLSNAQRQPVENPAGNLLADAQRWGTEADIGFVNNGSLRRSLPEGPVDYATLYEFQPFQNELVRLHMDGALLREVLEHGLTDDGRPWTHVAGIQVEVDPTRPRGERVVRILRSHLGIPGDVADLGVEIALTDAVTLGTTEFLALGGDGFTMFSRARLERVGRVDVDALIEYLGAQPDPVPAPEVGRWFTSVRDRQPAPGSGEQEILLRVR
jgi:2',3'-cyclic-nucleotide 2'-phosphodiesterase (5'-nucleotidase family)